MIFNSNIANGSFSDLEKLFSEIIELEKKNLRLLWDLQDTKEKLRSALELAQIESKVYSGIKKYFK